jgi:hypothetical protein
MIERIVLIIIFIFQTCAVNAQDLNELGKIVDLIKKYAIGEISIKCIDLDNDDDKDYLFTYCCGESNCFEVYLTINGKLERVIREFGNLSFDYNNSVDFKPSNLVLKSDFNHCCGESPFDSHRKFIFKNDHFEIVENYVRYDHENYCYDDRLWDYTFFPSKFLPNPYFVKITEEKNNIRFSADLEGHKADFVCIENSNVIGQLKKNAIVTVLAEMKGKDGDLRTWLYIEVNESDLNKETCNSPLTYDFKGQKLRGWISDKYTKRQ